MICNSFVKVALVEWIFMECLLYMNSDGEGGKLDSCPRGQNMEPFINQIDRELHTSVLHVGVIVELHNSRHPYSRLKIRKQTQRGKIICTKGYTATQCNPSNSTLL